MIADHDGGALLPLPGFDRGKTLPPSLMPHNYVDFSRHHAIPVASANCVKAASLASKYDLPMIPKFHEAHVSSR